MIKKVCVCGLFCALACMAHAVKVSVVNLPFVEGTLFVAVFDGEKMVEGKVIAVEADRIDVHFDLSAYEGKKLELKAFQDLNGNGDIDFDEYGRPTEPCLLETLSGGNADQSLSFELQQF